MQSSPFNLASPLTVLNGVGPALSKKLERLGLFRVEDLLFLLPLRYEDRTQLIKIGALRAGTRCLISGEVLLAETVYRGRRNLLVRISDGSGQLTLRFFHFSRQQQAQFKTGARLTCFGEARKGSAGFEMIHPEYRFLREEQGAAVDETLTPIYPATEGVQQGRLRNLTDQVLRLMRESPPVELLPKSVLEELGLPPLADAVLTLHRPPADANIEQMLEGTHPCQQRLAFEELLAHYISLRKLRALAQTKPAVALAGGNSEVEQFVGSLPFALTSAQKRVVDEIVGDLGQPHPMMRLIQGDVGSGKTVVAAIACLKAIACGVQAVIMAPTELLAEQHYKSFTDWFRPLGIEPAWLSGSQRAAARRDSLEAIAAGSAKLIVGTHALFQEGVRMALRDKAVGDHGYPHQLVMTATPIPRTLAMAAYADLDTSVIDELPPGRQPVTTIALPETRRDEIIARVRMACEAGQQAYWVCPLIEESDVLDFEAAEVSYEMLTRELSELRVGLVHGRMRPAEKERGMQAFKDGVIQVLVATTVIEVGVDVPDASLMIIENAERMGLSQLHQLRGRVGRGAKQSHCVLMYKPPLGQLARNRLAVLRDTNDGFVVAQRDLELRGPGELLGTRQTGLPDYRIANLVRDAQLMPQVQTAADFISRNVPDSATAIVRRWCGNAEQYGKV